MVKVRPIRESRQPTPLVASWVSVIDAEGRVRLEMRWHICHEHRSAAA